MVLGQVGDARRRIDRRRLPVEAPEAGEADLLGAGAARAGGPHLEGVPVALRGRDVGQAGHVLRLLAGDPGAPGGGPAGAVADGAGGGGVGGLHPQVRSDDQGGRAAGGLRVVGVVEEDGDDPGEAPVGVLVVHDQQGAPAAQREGRHPVRLPRPRVAVGQGVAALDEHPVLEALREVEHAARAPVRHQRPVAGERPAAARTRP